MNSNPNFDITRIESGKDIKEQIIQIQKDVESSKGEVGFEFKLQQKYDTFYQKYPTLFQKVVNGIDEKTLGYMLEMLDKIKENKTSETQASQEVGKRLFNDWKERNTE